MKSNLLLVFMFVFAPFLSQAQSDYLPCSVVPSAEQDALIQEFHSWYYDGNNQNKVLAVKYVDVTMHLVANSDGSQRMRYNHALTSIHELNQQYTTPGSELVFCIKDLTTNIKNFIYKYIFCKFYI